MTSSTRKKSSSIPRALLLYCIPLVVAAAYIIQFPQPKLKWEHDFLPMAKEYMGNTKSGSQDDSAVFEGLTVVITGATSGIGRALALFLYGKGATVIATGRSVSKLDELSKEIQKGQKGTLVPVIMEMSDLRSVAEGADKIKAQFHSIDVLICNAGMHYAKGFNFFSRPQTSLGHDVAFTVNYLSHFLLTKKLLPELLNSSKKPSLIHISSTYHFAVDGRDLDPSNGTPSAANPGGSGWWWKDGRAYANSKLAQILHTRALKQYNPSLRAVSVCPGWAATRIGGDEGSFAYEALARLAFPTFGEGWGLASTLLAIVDARQHATDGDFYINTKLSLFGPLLSLRSSTWFADLGIRDLLADILAKFFIITFQKFFPAAMTAASSPESYNLELATRLHKWSNDEITRFL